MTKKLKAFYAVSIIVALSLPFWLTPESVALKDVALMNVGQLLGSLFAISLFLERALDVFLTTFRAEKSERLDIQIQEHQERISRLAKENTKELEALEALGKKLEEIKQEKLKHKSETRSIALWSGLTLGILISAAGIRSLHTLIEPSVLSAISPNQSAAFHFLDVLLTGGLLAGGSDGIHKLAEVYRIYMEATSMKAKKAGS